MSAYNKNYKQTKEIPYAFSDTELVQLSRNNFWQFFVCFAKFIC